MELETFKITVLPLREKLINFSLKLTQERADAEDIVQEAFLKLWYIREKLDGYHSVEALAMQVTKNLTLDKLRARRPEGPDIDTLSIDSGSRSPAELLEQKDAAARIRELRGACGYTQEELAKRIGASKSYISRIEKGLIEPGVSTFYRIIEALGLRIEIVKPVV